MKTLRRKGIRAHARGFSLLGIESEFLGIVAGTIRERRVPEALWGLYCYIAYKPGVPEGPALELGSPLHAAEFLRLNHIADFICRRESVFQDASVFIAGEYGQPGARIVFVDAAGTRVYDPYASDPRVYHIHCIAHAEDDLFYVATGDTGKYLDVMKINGEGCSIVHRIFRRNAGFTATARSRSTQWFGTDFSGRQNYLLNIKTGKKFFLPLAAFTEYVISMSAIDPEKIAVVTKRLALPTGHRTVFDVARERFSPPQPVHVLERTGVAGSPYFAAASAILRTESPARREPADDPSQ